MITKVTSPKTPSTKNLYGKAGWMNVRFEDLMQKIEKKKKISKATGKLTLSMDQGEYESIIDCIERAKKSINMKENIKQIKLQNDSLDDEVFQNLINFSFLIGGSSGKTSNPIPPNLPVLSPLYKSSSLFISYDLP